MYIKLVIIAEQPQKTMISKEGIRCLYRSKRPSGGYSDEFLQSICEKCQKFHRIEIKDGFLVIGALDTNNPFRRIKFSCIQSIEDLGDEVAVVLNPCIIFFNNITGKININLRNEQRRATIIRRWLRKMLRFGF